MTLHQHSWMYKALSVLSAGALLIGSVAWAPSAVPAQVSAEQAVSSTLLGLDSVPPAGFSSVTNPYGYDYGVAFSLSVGNELLYLGGADAKKQTSVLNTDSLDTLKSYVKEPNKKDGSYALPDGTWNWVRATAFDNDVDKARDDQVLFVGVKGSDRQAYAWVLDVPNNTIIGPTELGNMDWISDDYDQYSSTSLFEVAAADLDGDGVDSLFVYAPLNLKDTSDVGCSLYELTYTGTTLIKGTAHNHLLMDAYINDQNHKTYKDTSDADNTCRDKLAVSMQVADLNGDNIDDLSVLSWSHDRYSDAGAAYYVPQLKVCYGGEGSTADYTMLEIAHISEDERIFPVAASLAAGDFNGDSIEDLYVVGVKTSNQYASSDPETLSISDDHWYLQGVFGSSNGLQTNGYTTVESNEWYKDGFYVDDCCYGKVMSAGVAISGGAAPEMLFISGSLYEVSTGTPVNKLTSGYFGSADQGLGGHLASNTFMQSVAVGNFDNNEAGREQVAFTIGMKQKGQDDYYYMSGFVSGKSFNDVTAEDGSVNYGTATGYYCTDMDDEAEYIHQDKGDDVKEGLNCLLISADIDDDGIKAKYLGASFVYSDPDVKAVLQAAPYFGDLTTSGKNSTGYSLETTYSHGDTSTNSFNGSVGFAAGGGFPGVFSTNFTLSATGGWTDSFTETFSTSYKETFAAGSEDVVVVHRIPLIAYQFDVMGEDGRWSGETQLEFTVPREPVYETLTIDKYNAFAESYNKQMRDAGATDFDELVPIDAAANWMDGNEGNPYAYNQHGWANDLIKAEQISTGSFALGKSNAANSIAWNEGNSDTDSFTSTVGVSLTYSALFGTQGVGGAGISLAGNYAHGWGSTTTEGTATGTACTVQDLDGTGLVAKGMPQEVLDQYGFTWTFGQWERHLSGKDDHKTPFLGYALTNISSPTAAVTTLKATAVSESAVLLEWNKPTVYQGGPAITGYYVYRVNDDGTRTKLSDQLAADAQSYTVSGLDRLTSYTFVITSTGDFDGITRESTWSNTASAVTRIPEYTVTFGADDPAAADVVAYSTGHVAIESGAAVKSHSVVSLIATAADSNSRVLGLRLDRGNGTETQWIAADDAQTTAQCAVVVTGNTVISVVTERTVEESEITFTGTYTDGDTPMGTVSATVSGMTFPAPGGVVSEAVTFTATPAKDYVLKGWEITAGSVTEMISSMNMNPLVLEPKKAAYHVKAVFVPASDATVVLTVRSTEGGTVRAQTQDGTAIAFDRDGRAELPMNTLVTFTATPATGYVFNGWGEDVAEQTESSFSVSLSTNLTVGASFRAPIKYKLNYQVTTPEAYGSVAITPSLTSGSFVAAGSEVTLHATAAEGYRIDTVTLTVGETVETMDLSDETYTEAQKTFAVTANTDIAIAFEPIAEYQVYVESSGNGRIEVMVDSKPMTLTDGVFDQVCIYKQDVTVTAIPYTQCTVADMEGDTWQYIGNGRYQLTYADITADIRKTVTFVAYHGYVIGLDDGDGYRIADVVRSPDYTYPLNEVKSDGSLSFRVIPTDRRGIQSVSLFDPYHVTHEIITRNDDGSWTVEIPKVADSPMLEVLVNTGYRFTASAGEGGSVQLLSNGQALKEGEFIVKGETLEIRAVPEAGRALKSLTVNGVPVTDTTWTVQGAMTVAAEFTAPLFDIPAAGEGYSIGDVQITPADESIPEGKVPYGSDVQFVVTPEEGMLITKVTSDAGVLSRREDGTWLVTVEDVRAPIGIEVKVGNKQEITLKVLLAMFYYINGMSDLPEEAKALTDLNGDGVVNLSDVMQAFYIVNNR